MTVPDVPETVVRRFTDNGCEVTSVVNEPADAQQVLYGNVTRDGVLVGSYYPADRVRQSDWRIVTADGDHLCLGGHPVTAPYEGDAVFVLTTILTARESHEVERLLRDATRPPRR
ncbi:hypothetical protein FKR81_37360 [Lentzea tibetensis]|uniref:Uncharacterized protein n=1 Tax=Lentzea tibetensis TaxID=2591470 RepID=A0A563EHE6_9PSEU|nr:hypothetical protein [Lentzea tibetensis]TWP46044.1 hypothetical protein FKR81_37360 [Lentzea tibetensis]